MIYLDSSAALKLVREEAETAALISWLRTRSELPVVTSELGKVEVMRAARRIGPDAVTEARAVIGDMGLIPLDSAVLDLACDAGDVVVRTLDALHLASAILIREDLTAFVAYDHRLLSAAEAAGLPACAPIDPDED